jgi:hypothetical protein
MGSRFPSHQLSNGLYVSGRPEQPKEKAPTICSNVMPYTGGDIKKSGELGKMFDLHVEKSRKSGPLGNAPSRNPILVVDPTTLVRFRLQFLVLAVQPEQNQTLDLLISMENQQRGHLVPSLGE